MKNHKHIFIIPIAILLFPILLSLVLGNPTKNNKNYQFELYVKADSQFHLACDSAFLMANKANIYSTHGENNFDSFVKYVRLVEFYRGKAVAINELSDNLLDPTK